MMEGLIDFLRITAFFLLIGAAMLFGRWMDGGDMPWDPPAPTTRGQAYFIETCPVNGRFTKCIMGDHEVEI